MSDTKPKTETSVPGIADTKMDKVDNNSTTQLEQPPLKKHKQPGQLANLEKQTEGSDQMVPKKRKRKIFSCETCRKLKTRCDFEAINGKCHRCTVLKLHCSLSNTAPLDEHSPTPEPSYNTISPSGQGDVNTGNILNQNVQDLKSKIDLIMDHLNIPNSQSSSASNNRSKPFNESSSDYQYFRSMKSKRNHLDNSTQNSPITLISRIDKQLSSASRSQHGGNRVNAGKNHHHCQANFHDIATSAFSKFWNTHTNVCLKLADNFLTKAHFWIIPGGIKSISHEYAQRHPFITSIFILISLSFDHEEINIPQEGQFQLEVFNIVSSLMGKCLIMSESLTDHDAEGLLYLSVYTVSRRDQLRWDDWVISGTIVKLMMSMKQFSFNAIRKRVMDEEKYDDDDLFHLRIWNAVCCSHIGLSIGYGRDVMISEDYLKVVNGLILNFPQANVEDRIKFAEYKLLKICFDLFHVENLMLDVIKYDQYLKFHNGTKVIELKDLKDWELNNQLLIDQDTSQILMFCYDYFHICLIKRIISGFVHQKGNEDHRVLKFIQLGHLSIEYYGFRLIERFLELKSFLIKGAPNYLMNQLIYTSLQLYELLNNMSTPVSKGKSINLITRIYWKLMQIGEKKNECTMSVGKIIKSMILDKVDTSGVSSSNPTSTSNGISSKTNIPGLSISGSTDQEDYEPLHDEINHEFSSDYGFKTSDVRSNSPASTVTTSATTATRHNSSAGGYGIVLPDVEKFESFEDFFRDMFR